MRVIVCGGRRFLDRATIRRELWRIHREQPITVLIHGNARGADRLAGIWGKWREGVRVHPEPITREQWVLMGNFAGPARNQRMLDLGPDLVVAFPGGRGTADMVRRSRRAGVRVLEPLAEQPSLL